MQSKFLAVEILEMNIIEERNGAAFYSALADSTNSAPLQKAAAAIAEQEKEHEIRFARLRDELEDDSEHLPETDEYETYLTSLLGHRIFPDEDAALNAAATMDDRTAVKYALRTEHATLKLLDELKKQVHPDALNIIALVASEEQQHISQLEAILEQLE